jgi:uncharacterized protein YebE (UPF0316 family)
MDIASSDLYSYVYLPLLIFFARMTDVTLMTLRIIFVSRGKRYLAPLLGFVEVFIWIAVVSQIIRGANNLVAYLAYAAGFAAGSYVGIYVENRLAIGTLVVRAITLRGAEELVAQLISAGYGVTTVDGHGSTGPVKLVYTVIKRKDLPQVMTIMHQAEPKPFITVEEVRSAEQGIFPENGAGRSRFFRKTK